MNTELIVIIFSVAIAVLQTIYGFLDDIIDVIEPQSQD